MSISAFGVEHGEIAKFSVPVGQWAGKVGSVLGDAGKGVGVGARGGVSLFHPGTPGAFGAKAGGMGRTGAKYTRANLKPIGIGVGAGGAAGYGAHRNKYQ